MTLRGCEKDGDLEKKSLKPNPLENDVRQNSIIEISMIKNLVQENISLPP